MTRGYLDLLPIERRVMGAELVCNRVTLPKHRFILWLATLGRLFTKDRLGRLGIESDNKMCVMCTKDKEETVVHLFQECT